MEYYPDTKAVRRPLLKSVATEYPNIAAQWDHTKNKYGPEYFAPAEHVTVHLICQNGHSYSPRLDWVTSKHRGCPHCSAARKTSFPEQYLYELLKSIYGEGNVLNRFKLNKMEYDIVVPHLNLLIEYDGIAWHSDSLERHTAKALNAVSNRYCLISIAEYKDGGTKPTSHYFKQQGQEIIYYQIKGEYSNIEELGKQLLQYIAFLDPSIMQKLTKISTKTIKTKAKSTVLNGVPRENSFGYKHPELLRFWDKEKNTELGIDPYRISENIGSKVYWKCPYCGNPKHESTHYMLKRFRQCERCKQWVYDCKPDYIENIQHPRNRIKYCKLFNTTYNDIRSTSALFKLFLEYCLTNNYKAFNNMYESGDLRRIGGTPVVSTNRTTLMQPSQLFDTEYYYDSHTESDMALKILKKIVTKYGLYKSIYIEYEE